MTCVTAIGGALIAIVAVECWARYAGRIDTAIVKGAVIAIIAGTFVRLVATSTLR